jgi:L-2-hydroxyglutarate oxidase LhgO
VTGQGLFVESTAAFNPKAVLNRLCQELTDRGVHLAYGQTVGKVNVRQGEVILPNQHRIAYGHLFNTAGLHADRIARGFQVGGHLTLLPFKGIYYRLDEQAGFAIRHHIYPVPDLSMPFLGVHLTRDISGAIMVGPTAVPAFGRENYTLLEGLDLGDTPNILFLLAGLYLGNTQKFREFAHQEGLRYFKPRFVKAAQALLPGLRGAHLKPSAKVGIRPQLLDLNTHRLVQDFLIEEAERSTHILNAISPAFTSAFSFARFVLDRQFKG